jgi:CheY-like chemotaxis protein
MLRRSLGPSIDIRMEFEESLALIRADPNQLELALLNLALNARDAMPQGGRLSIAARRRRAEVANALNLASGEYVCVVVTDTGVGMDEATLKRAAEPFFTTKGVGKGTGLGLSMVYGLAAQSGGVARLQSRLGVGTAVELWLPVAPAGEPAQPRPTAHVAVGTGRACSVLLVDDDALVSEPTVALLEQLGHRVLVAATGQLALDVLRLEPTIELVITDYAMPGMNGLELAARIREFRPKLPIILATGYAEVPSGEEHDLPRLDKPYRLDALAAVIAQAIDQSGSSNVVPLSTVRRA